MKEKNRVQHVYASRDNKELTERYDEWAKTYEADLERDFAYRGPQVTVEFITRYVPRDAKILDAGAGTGLMGQLLTEQGYRDIAGIDLSPGMLAEAGKKMVYRELRQMVMGEPLDFPTGSFDSVVSVGVLTLGHAPPGSFDELIRVTRPGGYIIYTLRQDIYENNGFKEKQSALETEGKWQLVEVSENIQVLPKGEPDVYHQVWVYRVTRKE